MGDFQFYQGDFSIKDYLKKDLNESPRVKEINKRWLLNSRDGRVIDEHDQFYRDHKLLLVLFRVSRMLFCF